LEDESVVAWSELHGLEIERDLTICGFGGDGDLSGFGRISETKHFEFERFRAGSMTSHF
jgi:hypothetical protein